MRCFLAVPLEEPALTAAQQQLAGLHDEVSDVRWVRPDALHITVHFFGSVTDEQTGTALAAVLPTIDATRCFALRLDALGAFPERGQPRVLWLGMSEQPPVFDDLVHRCREALSRTGFTVEERPFRAHCTLGRPRAPWPRTSQRAWRATVARGVAAMRFDASRLVLYESVHAIGGNRYVERANHPFPTTTKQEV